MPEVAYLRHGLLPQEAPFREIDRVFEARLRRQRIGSEIRSHTGDPASDPPRLEVLVRDGDEPTLSEMLAHAVRRVAGSHDDVVSEAEDRRVQDQAIVPAGVAVENRHEDRPLAQGLQLDGGRQHVGGEDVIECVRLILCLQQEEPVAHPAHMEVRPDPPAGRQQQGSATLPGRESFDVGSHEIVEPARRVAAPHGDHSPADELGVCRAGLQCIRSRRSRGVPSPLGSRRAVVQGIWKDIGPVEIPRTLIVTNDFPPRVGGIQRTLESLCRALPAAEISVIAPRCEGSDAFDAAAGFDVVRERDRFVWPMPAVADRLDAEITRSGAEVVLFGDAFPLALLGPRLASRGVPYVVLAHGFDYWLSTVPGAHSVMKRMTSRAARVAGCSEFISRRVRGAVPRSVPVSVLHPGADVERFRPDLPTADIRERHGLGDRPLIVCVSRLVPRKGQDVLIRSMRAVQRRVPEAGLLIVGSGPYASKLRGLAERAPTRSVFFVGEVAEEDLPRYYAVGDVFAMPCRTRMAGLEVEGWGNVFIEAAACGRPVVVGDSGGSREALVHGETGLLVDGSDVDGVADALATLLEDPAYARRLGKTGRARVEREHTWPLVAERLSGWLREAASA